MLSVPEPEPIEFNMSGQAVNGQVIGQVKASDPDAGQTLTFKIISSNPNKLFAIDAASGVLTISNATYYNRNFAAYYVLIIMVTDSGGKDKNGKFMRLSAQATVHIYRKK